ncbi:winged helix-turn-helix transcriptional regulator [Streptomyces canus]
MALGALNAWTAQRHDYGAFSTALCLCVCAAGLFGEDLVQPGYRRDRVVLAHIATHPGAATRQVARAVGASERVVARNLDRLTDDGLLVLVMGGEPPVVPGWLPELRPLGAAREPPYAGAQHSRRSPVSQTGDRPEY